MANDSESSPSPMIVSPAAAAAASPVVDDSSADQDACSICLEPFNSDDPPAVTDCKHEYHLQCILEWSQRSKECPICWRVLALKDPASQELLAAVAIERNMRSRVNVRHTNEDVEANHDAPQLDDSDFEERIMRHFAAATNRVRLINRRRRQASSGIGPTQVVPSVPVGVQSNQTQNNESTVQFGGFGFPGDGSAAAATSGIGPASPSVPAHGSDPFKLSQPPAYGPQESSSSEFLAFSESIKSKWSAASARYKESISKGTRGFKEKLSARNTTVKEFGREVQREMSAGIAGVTRMIERLDLTSKRTGGSEPLSTCTMGTSNFSSRGECEQGNVAFQSHDGCRKNSMTEVIRTPPSLISKTNTGQTEISLGQNKS